MKLNGNSLEQFEKWLFDKRFEESFLIDVDGTVVVALGVLDFFKQLDVSMQYGVLVDFFESVGLYLGVDSWATCGNVKETFFWFNVKDSNQESLIKDTYQESLINSRNKTRPQARTKAIEKANEILNSRV